jgi:arylsulfatase
MDLAPTFLELAGARYPGTRGTSLTRPMLGTSMVSYLQGKAAIVHDTTYAVGLWSGGHASFRKGNFKLVNTERPYREDRLMLYDVSKDPAETTDLSRTRPATYRAMLDAWRQYLKDNDIRLPAVRD